MRRSLATLLFLTALLFAMGLLMVFNTSSAEVLDRGLNQSPHHALIKQLTFAAIGCVVAAFIWQFPPEDFFEKARKLLLFGVFLLILVLIPGVGHKVNGARRWLNLGLLTFQPSEFMKIILPLYAIAYLSICPKLTFPLFLRLLLQLSLPIFLILLEPDNGTTAILLATLCVLFFVARVPSRYWARPLGVLVFFGVLIGAQLNYIKERIHVYLHPEADLLGRGHQPYQAKIAAGSGGLFGVGFGESLQKLNYLPEARNDYIAAIFAEEFGFLGMAILVTIYMAFAAVGFKIASKTQDERAYQLAAILTFLITFQGFINLGVISGLLPSKGMNLPFFSQGGSSLIANIMALTLILKMGTMRCQKPSY